MIETITVANADGRTTTILTRAQYWELRESGMLWEFHPGAPLSWPTQEGVATLMRPIPAATTEARFRADLLALLERYNGSPLVYKGVSRVNLASIEADDHSSGYLGGDYRMIVEIPSVWDDQGNCLRDRVSVDLGRSFP